MYVYIYIHIYIVDSPNTVLCKVVLLQFMTDYIAPHIWILWAILWIIKRTRHRTVYS